jgi:hypothetical protein
MDLFVERGFLVADGKRMAVSFPQKAQAKEDRKLWLLSDYYPTEISIFRPTHDVTVCGDYFPRMISGQPEVTIEIKAHGVQSVPFEEGIKLFRNADSLSVNELLAIAYQKMDSRQS